jgi:hypothetical protein
MVRCPATGRELSTGVEMDAATFEGFPIFARSIKCRLQFGSLLVYAKRGSGIQRPPLQLSLRTLFAKQS